MAQITSCHLLALWKSLHFCSDTSYPLQVRLKRNPEMCAFVNICRNMYIYIYLHTICVCVYVHIYIYVYIYIYVHLYIYIIYVSISSYLPTYLSIHPMYLGMLPPSSNSYHLDPCKPSFSTATGRGQHISIYMCIIIYK